ncbi:MAG: hypothetical protein WDZ51_16230, partial [Pirellulaceae bacterium]
MSTQRQSRSTAEAKGQIGLFPFFPIFNTFPNGRLKDVTTRWEFVFNANDSASTSDPARWFSLFAPKMKKGKSPILFGTLFSSTGR